MKKEIKVLALQFESIPDDKDANLKKVAKLMKENADFNADIVILPEVWSVGLNYKNYPLQAENIPAQTTMLLSGLAEGYNTNIIGGSFIEQDFNGKLYNTTLVFNRSGAVIGQYRKNHIFSHFGSLEKEYIESGKDTCVVDIEGIKIGIATCYDIRFPELFRKMLKQGAEMFAISAAFPYERIEQWNLLTRARALENQAFLVACNQFGASNIVSPYGEILYTTKQEESVLKSIINLEEVFEYRKEASFIEDCIF